MPENLELRHFDTEILLFVTWGLVPIQCVVASVSMVQVPVTVTLALYHMPTSHCQVSAIVNNSGLQVTSVSLCECIKSEFGYNATCPAVHFELPSDL